MSPVSAVACVLGLLFIGTIGWMTMQREGRINVPLSEIQGAVTPLCYTVSGKDTSGVYSCAAAVENGRLVWRKLP